MTDFELGLSLTGTVSAGAYTGGVIDFIFEALEEWQKIKDANKEKYRDDTGKYTAPWHNVKLVGMSGTSGGGVTNGIILKNLRKQFPHISKPPLNNQITGNDFYDAWVLSLGINELLDSGDIVGANPSVTSLLNGEAIPKIADRLLVKSAFGNHMSRPYIDEHFFSIITVTNLRGIPYKVKFKHPAQKQLVYYRNADYLMFEFAQSTPVIEDAYWLPYDTSLSDFDATFSKLRAACLATCAFPAAFKAQAVSQDIDSYIKRKLGNAWDLFDNNLPYNFLSSDGGVVDSQPFELLHKRMLPPDKEHNPHDAEQLTKAIIMVAPLEVFDPVKVSYDVTKEGLLTVLPGVINALRHEAVYSAEEIEKALDENYYSRYIIAPSRTKSPTATDNALPAITGTTLEAFGAFISQDFRVHDYFLGRRNAQLFLKKHFAIPKSALADNPVLAELDAENRFPDLFFTDGGVDYFPIIPLYGTALPEAYFPEWPKGKGYDLDEVEDLLSGRSDKLVKILKDGLDVNWFERIFLNIIAGKIKKAAINKLMEVIRDGVTDSGL